LYSRHWVVFGACASALGCGSLVLATPLNAPTHPLTPRAKEAVEVYSSTLPARPHQDVAILQISQSGSGSLAAMLDKLRKKAGEMGCDAIFITGTGEHVGAPSGTAWALIDPSSDLLYATCIEWLGPPAPATLTTTPPATTTMAATAPTPPAPTAH
jgi:hypothetical protein